MYLEIEDNYKVLFFLRNLFKESFFQKIALNLITKTLFYNLQNTSIFLRNLDILFSV